MTNEKRLIDANALAKHIKDLPTWWADDGGVYPGGSMKYPDGMYYPEDIISSIDNAPSVDAVEVVHGRWITEWDGEHLFNICYCSACNKGANKDVHNEFILSDFCPNCGAKMDGGNDYG